MSIYLHYINDKLISVIKCYFLSKKKIYVLVKNGKKIYRSSNNIN